MRLYIENANNLMERALTFRYPNNYTDEAEQLQDLLDSEDIKYVMYDDSSWGLGYKFIVARSGRRWNDIIKLINSIKPVKYRYIEAAFENKDGKWIEVNYIY